MRMRGSIITSFFMVFALCTGAHATVITQTAAELDANPNVSYPNVTPSGLPSSLTFGAGSGVGEWLLRWDLFSAGSFAPGDPAANVDITMQVRRLSTSGRSDWDPVIGLFDGTNVLYGAFLENDGGTYAVQNSDSLSDGVTQNLTPNVQSIVGGAPAIGGVADLVLSLALDPNQGSLTLSGFNGSLSNGPFTFDRSSALSVMVGRSSFNEQISILSMTVETSLAPSVPEPSTLALFGLGIAGLGFRSRRT